MAESFEKSMRKVVEAVGIAVENFIGKAKRASMQISTHGGLKPVLSIESQLSVVRLCEFVDNVSEKILTTAISVSKEGGALEIGEGPASYGSRFLAAGAGDVVSVEMGGKSVGHQGDATRGFVACAESRNLPFTDGRFSYVLARMASQHQGDMPKAISEIGRVMAKGGQGVLVDYHPFGLYAKKGHQKARHHDAQIHRFEDYYKLAKKAGMRIVDVREVFVEETMRQFFKEAEIAAYRNLKNTPLLVFLFLYKPRGA